MVSIRHSNERLSPMRATGVLRRIFLLLRSRFGEVMIGDLRVHIDVFKLVMGSIEVEESIAKQPTRERKSIQNSASISIGSTKSFAGNSPISRKEILKMNESVQEISLRLSDSSTLQVM